MPQASPSKGRFVRDCKYKIETMRVSNDMRTPSVVTLLDGNLFKIGLSLSTIALRELDA